jgi:CHASE3 domain sensor protein
LPHTKLAKKIIKKIVHWTSWHVQREPLRTSGLKEGADKSGYRTMDQAMEECRKQAPQERRVRLLHASAARQQGIIIIIILIIIIIIIIIIIGHAVA